MTSKDDHEKGGRESGSVNRRDFLKSVGVTTLATSVLSRADAEAQAARQAGAPPPGGGATYVDIRREVAENLKKRGIVGYTDRLGAAPGETIRFMVSSESPRYRADIVRLIHGDPNPAGPGIKEIEIATPVAGEYEGKHQDLPMGSYAVVPDHPDLRIRGSFTITAWIAPTTVHPRPAEGILTKWSEENQSGYGLFIEEDGTLALRLGAETVRAGAPLRPWVPAIPGTNERPQGVSTQWCFVAAAFDASRRKVLLYQQPQNQFPFDAARSVVERATAAGSPSPNDAPLLIAAYSAASGVAGHYNGKIDNPRLYGRALSRAEIEAIEKGEGPADAIASWDFSLDIDSDKIADVSSRGHHGRAVNAPMRAVTGHDWDSSETDFRRARDRYGAIYFHDDDLLDALWEVSFELSIPEDLRSGLYAARLHTGSHEDYIPFVVRPKKGAPQSKIALLIPTFSYLAYAGTGTSAIRPLSLYSRHSDGSGVCYSSHLRPITNMRPKIDTRNPWQFMADTHLIDWLEVKGFEVDLLTDHDLHNEGVSAVAPYRVVLTGTHPEYHSLEMLEGLRLYLDRGGRLMYMGGNGFYWVTAMDPTGRFVEVRRRDGTEHWQGAPGEHHHSTTGEPGGLWRFRGLAPQQFFGVGFTAQGFDRNSPYRRMPGSFDPRARFIFEGVGEDELIGNFPSLVLSFGAAGSELDRADFALGTPPHTLVLASSYGHSDEYTHVVEQVNTTNWAEIGGTSNPLVRADMVYLEYPKGGGVFSTSSIAWCGSLSFNNYNNNVSRITENVLRRFAAEEPLPPPVAADTEAGAGMETRGSVSAPHPAGEAATSSDTSP